MKVIFFAVALVGLAAAADASAGTPSLGEVLASSQKHFPAIQQAKANRDAAEAQVQQSLGAFDLSLENESSIRTSGFYDGRQTSTKLVKPLQDFNAKVKAGYRVSDGDFPIYDDYLYTNSGGEFNLELFLSLLRDRDIDDDRLSLWNNKLDTQKAEQEIVLAKIATQNAAMKAYYEWLAATEIYNTNRQLLALAQDRQKALKTRSVEGDVASVLLVENSQYIFRREGHLNDAQRLLKNAQTNLSFYWRDDQGNMLMPDTAPKPVWSDKEHAHDSLDDISRLYESQPSLKIIETEILKSQNELKAAENKLLPRADLGVRTSRDNGDGSITRRGTDNVIGLFVSIPLQNNTAEGQISKTKAQIKSLEYERELRRNRLYQQLKIIENNIVAGKNSIDYASREVAAAEKMQNAEAKIFKDGGSDYFLLNIREENVAAAKIKYTTALLDLHRVLADYYAVTMNFERLNLKGDI